MASNALERTARALDLIPYIVDRPGILIEDLAEEFKTTPAEISEILNIVFMCGLPGYTHLELIDLTTEDGSVSIIDPQNLREPRKLSQIEIVSSIFGLKNLISLGLSPEAAALANSLMEKLKELLNDVKTLDVIETSRALPQSPHKQTIDESIKLGTTLKITYKSLTKDEISQRTISPHRLYARNGHLFVEAVAHDVGDIRNFRVDRIAEIRSSTEPRIEATLEVLPDAIQVEVFIPRSHLFFVETHRDIIESQEIVGERMLLTLNVKHTDWLFRALFAIDGEVEIITPDFLAAKFRSTAKQALEGYKELSGRLLSVK